MLALRVYRHHNNHASDPDIFRGSSAIEHHQDFSSNTITGLSASRISVICVLTVEVPPRHLYCREYIRLSKPAKGCDAPSQWNGTSPNHRDRTRSPQAGEWGQSPPRNPRTRWDIPTCNYYAHSGSARRGCLLRSETPVTTGGHGRALNCGATPAGRGDTDPNN